MGNARTLGRVIAFAATMLVGCQAVSPLPTPGLTGTPAPTAPASTPAAEPSATPTATPTGTPQPSVTTLSDALAAMDGERIVFHRHTQE